MSRSNYACSSDARYIKNVSTYANALEKVLGLRGVDYFRKTDEYKEKGFSKDKQIVFIAQEVEKVIPELVYTDDKDFKTMSYERLTVVLVELNNIDFIIKGFYLSEKTIDIPHPIKI